VLESFNFTNELLSEGMLGMWRLLAHKGLIEIHFSDLCELLRDQLGESCFACAESNGPVRSKEVLEKLLAHPLLDGGQVLSESSAVLVSLLGGPDLTMAEVNRVMEQINRQCERAQIIMGAAIDERFQDKLAVTIVVARRDAVGQAFNLPTASSARPEARSTGQSTEGLDSQLLNNRAATARPASRIVAPPPSMPTDKMQQLAGRNGGRGRRNASRPNQQGQLPLEIVSKGRFDKSEPTIHKGEDLDVPTYIRRGIALN
jgi:cell division protein FtsZ